MSAPILSIRNLRVLFSRDGKWNEAVHGIGLDVFAGRTLDVVGESGSGKSVSSSALQHPKRKLSTSTLAFPCKACC